MHTFQITSSDRYLFLSMDFYICWGGKEMQYTAVMKPHRERLKTGILNSKFNIFNVGVLKKSFRMTKRITSFFFQLLFNYSLYIYIFQRKNESRWGDAKLSWPEIYFLSFFSNFPVLQEIYLPLRSGKTRDVHQKKPSDAIWQINTPRLEVKRKLEKQVQKTKLCQRPITFPVNRCA